MHIGTGGSLQIDIYFKLFSHNLEFSVDYYGVGIKMYIFKGAFYFAIDLDADTEVSRRETP